MFPSIDLCPYTSYYCEENVYKLCEMAEKKDELYAVFISNHMKKVPIARQKASIGSGSPVVFWDYHVILLEKSVDDNRIWDLDSLLPFPCPADIYINESFKYDYTDDERMRTRFRVIKASDYLSEFCSDRRHMKINDTYNALPPTWPLINPNKEHNIEDFWSMLDEGTKVDQISKLYTVDDLFQFVMS